MSYISHTERNHYHDHIQQISSGSKAVIIDTASGIKYDLTECDLSPNSKPQVTKQNI